MTWNTRDVDGRWLFVFQIWRVTGHVLLLHRFVIEKDEFLSLFSFCLFFEYIPGMYVPAHGIRHHGCQATARDTFLDLKNSLKKMHVHACACAWIR